ncbi:MAG: hypothetical protein WAP21_07345, partial [Bacteroidales bacterium]
MNKNFYKFLIILNISIFIRFNIFSQNIINICDFNNNVRTININDYFYQTINYDSVIHEHKGFDSLTQKPDTIQISENLISIKKPSFIEVINDDPNFYYSILYCTIQIFYDNKEIFFKDSVLTAGNYYFDEKYNILLIPLIIDQDIDDLFTTTILYYCNLNNYDIKLIVNNLSNSSSAITACDGGKIIFNSSDKLYVFDLKTYKYYKIVEFDNTFIKISKIDIKDNYIVLYYIN